MAEPVPIVATGFGWTAAGAWITALSVLGGIITLIVKQVGPWRRQTTEAEHHLREELTKRVTKLERMLEYQQFDCEADRAIARHKLGNLNQAFDSMIHMIEVAPEKIDEIIVHVKTMRRDHLQAELEEAGRINAVRLARYKEEAEDHDR